MPSSTARETVTRRWFMGGLGATLLATAATPLEAATPTRRLALRNLHTMEKLDVVYRRDGQLERGALAALNHLLRDWRRNEVLPIDPALFDIMSALAARLGQPARFEVVSGYRSPKTNAMLRRAGGGAAKQSLHMVGRAIDLRLEGVRLRDLRDAALQLQRGGVGYYPKSNFVHLDTGSVRTWRG